jgi:uncharacterized protein (DUF1697 family)
MARYVAFLRAVSPMNAKMPELKKCFESAGFSDVKTVLSSGNVVFSARTASETSLERKAEAAMKKKLGRAFYTIVRSTDALQKMLRADPFSRFRLAKNAKRVVTFVRKPHPAKLELPIELHGARILAMRGGEIFTAYVPSARGPVFMALIDRTFGKTVTTRTWETVKKCAAA